MKNLKLVRDFYYFYFLTKALPQLLRPSPHHDSYEGVLPIPLVPKQHPSSNDNNT